MGKNRQFKPEIPERCRDENAMNLFWRHHGAARKLSVQDGASGAVIEGTGRIAHEGDPRGAALKVLADPALRGVDRVAVTGRAFRASVELSTISEPEAVERAQLPLAGSWKNPPTKKGGRVSGHLYLLLNTNFSPYRL